MPLCLLLLSPPSLAQTDDRHPQATRIRQLQQQVAGAIARADYESAEDALDQLVELEPANFVNWYNYACALARQGEAEQAAQMLLRAVERGFIDINHLRADPSLAPIRDHPAYLKVVNNWDLLVEKHADANLEAVKRQYDPRRYQVVKDPDLRLTYYTAFDQRSFEAAREEIERIADWADEHVIEGVDADDFLADKPWVVVVLPTRADFRRWAAAIYGPGAINSMNQIGGSYMHDRKRLVAQDLGSSLRHEFLHVLHWRDNMHHRQAHPVWVQEGLCSLVEDYDMEAGELVPVPSWRTNSAVRLARAGHLMHIQDLATLPRDRFTGTRPLAHYAQARTLFLYLYRRGKLKEWYETYRRTFNEDTAGVLALEIVFDRDIDAINDDYAAWVRTLPEVPEWNRMPDGFVSIGVEIDPGEGEGPVIVRVNRREAYDAGLRRRDVITGVDGRPTRDVHELLRVLSDYSPGDTVEVSVRRRDGHETADVMLTERR